MREHIRNQPEQIDLIADAEDVVSVEIQHELAQPGKYKLYVHVNGITRLRICKLLGVDLDVPAEILVTAVKP